MPFWDNILNRIGSAESQAAGGVSTTAQEDTSMVSAGKQVTIELPESSEQNSALNPGESDPLKIEHLSYPIDLGNGDHNYIMRINIYRQVRSPSKIGTIEGNTFDFNRKTAQGNNGNYQFAGGAATLAGTQLAGKAAENLAKYGKGRAKVLGKRAEALINGSDSAIGLVGLGAVAADNISGFSAARRTYKNPRAYIDLYMPETLNFVDRHDFDSLSVTDVLGTAGRLSEGGVSEIAGRAAEKTGFVGSNFTDLLIYNSGYTINPQLEILYRGTKNREFVFSFRFLPRSATESNEVDNIIRTLRYHSSPQFGAPGVFVGAEAGRYFIPPSEFEVEFFYMDGDNAVRYNRLPRIAQCVLSSVDVNYAPQGQFSAFKKSNGELGGPIEIQMQLTFTETVILTKEDIGPSSSGGIGGY